MKHCVTYFKVFKFIFVIGGVHVRERMRVCAFLSAEMGSESNFVETVLSVNLYMGFGDQAQVVCLCGFCLSLQNHLPNPEVYPY